MFDSHATLHLLSTAVAIRHHRSHRHCMSFLLVRFQAQGWTGDVAASQLLRVQARWIIWKPLERGETGNRCFSPGFAHQHRGPAVFAHLTR
jgi:hypothetical protein